MVTPKCVGRVNVSMHNGNSDCKRSETRMKNLNLGQGHSSTNVINALWWHRTRQKRTTQELPSETQCIL